MTDDAEFQRGKALGYANGYATGRKKGRQDAECQSAHDERLKAEQAFWDAAFLASINGQMVGGAWGRTVDGKFKPWSTMDEYATCAANHASLMLAECRKRRP